MTQLILDNLTAAKLLGIREQAELRDEKGRVLGHFLPGPPRDSDGNLISPISDEEAMEILERERGTGRTWAEIKKELESM